MGTKCFIAIGVFSVGLLAYHVLMIYIANWQTKIALFIYMNDLILG